MIVPVATFIKKDVFREFGIVLPLDIQQNPRFDSLNKKALQTRKIETHDQFTNRYIDKLPHHDLSIRQNQILLMIHPRSISTINY
jgi:hypothetical protein